MTVVGVDGCPDGWLAVTYEGATFEGARIHSAIESVWARHGDAETILVTDGSLGVQAWHICPKIRELDELLRESAPDARNTVREAHPEVCFWGLAGERPMEYSKTGQPAAAFWERVAVLEEIDDDVLRDLQAGGAGIGGGASIDDLADAFALAVTASELTGPLRTLPPADSPAAERDPEGLPMEIVYSKRRT